MKKRSDLEETLKEKVSNLLEETMEKTWGLSIPKIGSDISDKVFSSSIDLYIPQHLSFNKAKKVFQKEFLKKQLMLHLGNVSQLAKSLEINRRSIHRVLKDLHLKKENVLENFTTFKNEETRMGNLIRSTLDQYKELIQPQKMEKIYEQLPLLSRNLADTMPHQDRTWREAEQEFEKQFLEHALSQNKWSVAKTSEAINLRSETVHRKIKKLGIQKGEHFS